MSLTVEQLTTAPVVDEIFDQLVTWLVNLGIPADKWRKGGVGRSILRAVAYVFVALAGVITFVNGAGFLPTAKGDFLTLLARYVYGVERITATFARGWIQATNPGGGLYTYNPGELVVRNAVTKKLYRNVSAVTLNPGVVSLAIEVEALEIGTASNAGVGEVSELVNTVPDVTLTNALAIVALDDQGDESLRAVCLARLGAASNAGPRGAYAYAIQTALNGGLPVNVNRWVVSPANSTGTVSVRVASPSGAASGGDVTAIADRIEVVARPDSVTLDLATVTTVTYTSTLTIWAKAEPGLTASTIQTAVAARLATYGATYAIGGLRKPPAVGGKLYDESVRAEAKAAHPSIYAVDSTGADLSLTFGQVAVLALTFDVRLVNPGATA